MKPEETNKLKAYPLIIVCFIVCRYKGYPLTFQSPGDFKLTILRNVVFSVHDLVMGVVQFRLPLPILHNINNSVSFILMIMELVFEGKKLTPAQKTSTVVTLLGIILISNYRYLEPLIQPSY